MELSSKLYEELLKVSSSISDSEINIQYVQSLLQRGATLDGNYEIPPLFLAIDSRNLKLVELLIERGAPVNGEDSEYIPVGYSGRKKSPLDYALSNWDMKGGDKIVATLLKHGAVPSKATLLDCICAPLFKQVEIGDDGTIDMLEMIIKAADTGVIDVNYQDVDTGITLLHLLAASTYTKSMRYLIEKGADVNITDLHLRTPAHYLMRQELLSDLKQYIGGDDDKDADDDNENADGDDSEDWTQRHVETLQILLQHGASLSIRDKDGKTPRDLANLKIAAYNSVEILEENRGTSLGERRVEEGNKIWDYVWILITAAAATAVWLSWATAEIE